MSRFNHLEFEDDLPEPVQDGSSEAPIIDQRFYLEKADAAFADENYQQALTNYARALEYDIDLEQAWVGQIRALIEIRTMDEAVSWSDRALERFKDSSEILAARSVAESRRGRSLAAIGYSDGAIKAGECSPYVWIARGEILIPINMTSAQACFARAVEMASEDWKVQAWIARSYIAHKLHAQAIMHFRQAVKLDPMRHTCWYWIGWCSEALGDLEEARRAYNQSLSVKPRYFRAMEALERLSTAGLVSKLSAGVRRLFGTR